MPDSGGHPTPLARLIAAQIAASGPISVADYMALCLGHPQHGYYTTRDPLGPAGDFVTAPEVSQMFGEMIGIWLAKVWDDMGRPTPLKLVELGPGRGTLMADILRVAERSGLARAAEPWLIETSPRLRQAQRARVPDARHAERLADVPDGPMLLVANEFFDALPVRQFVAGPTGWHERLVGLDGARLIFGLSERLPALGPPPAESAAWCERSASLETVAAEIAARLAAEGGAALIVDYGYRAQSRPPGPTLQAVSRHRKADPLARPGEVDLTWLIDFDALARALRPLACRICTQGQFLAAMGIGQRAAQLAAAAPADAGAVADALERLTDRAAMGTLFHALSALPAGARNPPAFGDPA